MTPERIDRRVIESCLACAMGHSVARVRAGRVFAHSTGSLFRDMRYIRMCHKAYTIYPDIFVPKPLKFPTKLLIGFDDRLLRGIDDWRRRQEDLPPRTE